MTTSLGYLLAVLCIGITLIVLLTAKWRIHAFFALVLAGFVVGMGSGLSAPETITAVKTGFGDIMKSLALLIVLGTTLGLVLEHTGSTRVLANYILKKIPHRYAALAMSITGYIVGLPLFCDSGYIVLSGLNKSIARRTQIPVAVLSVSLASGLYSVHCLIPPHPGATAAAGIIGVDYGKLILLGALVAIPAMLLGYVWSTYAVKKFKIEDPEPAEEEIYEWSHQPSVLKSFLPVIVPILLIAIKSFLLLGVDAASLTSGQKIISLLGDPVIALTIGLLLAFNTGRPWKKESVQKVLNEAIEKAGGILVIVGAGGAFGAVLQATKMGDHFNSSLPLAGLGLLFPFLLTSVLKTALGSSTVAIITAASIILPLLSALGLDSESGRLLCVLAMGAGSMMISHANDAYFWVIAKFSGIEMRTMLRVYTIATILMGLLSFLLVYLLSFVL
ncbi:GntP family permease [Flavisolibacter tropicus]|uniref:Gluconate transporter n=1 Tax=Flavisolibacter tropicus TaxID=1492898 RepID=A0A172TWW4_9BACT|nr:GntP family permease [Flavisolibacter tropicus]ANE51472.1 gluconate transporter [Flavisolibacter tropicus]